jgi:hypothetical protein
MNESSFFQWEVEVILRDRKTSGSYEQTIFEQLHNLYIINDVLIYEKSTNIYVQFLQIITF